MASAAALFIHSPELDAYPYPADCPFSSQRAGMTRQIMTSMGLLAGPDCAELAPCPAGRAEIERFHTPAYLDALLAAQSGDLKPEALAMGIGSQDCPVFRGMYDYAALACGASLAGAEALLNGRARVAFNPSGGYHHAGPARAAGFCYINDVVLACLRLAGAGRRVLFLDIDAHHCDGVQDAFYDRSDIMTVSFHESGLTLFPGTGFPREAGTGPGRGLSVNVPLPAGTFDEAFLRAFRQVFLPLAKSWQPDFLVMELGMDGLAGDPLTHLNLTNNAYAEALGEVMNLGRPLLAVGGGGYHPRHTARGWALAWSIMCDAGDASDLSMGLGGVMLESTDWQGGLRDRAQVPDEAVRRSVDASVDAVVREVKKTVFGLHGLPKGDTIGGRRGRAHGTDDGNSGMSIEKFFAPESVAIVGASRSPGKVGNAILVSLIRDGYRGHIYPVNPGCDSIETLACHPDLKSIGAVPDLVVIVVPAPAVLDVVRQCGALGVKAAVVITSGFREIGEAGQQLEREIVSAARQQGMRILGPNCLGVMVPARRLNASFAGELPAPGDIAYISQSGSLLSAIVDMANAAGIGFSKLVSLGNKADIGELEVIKSLGRDPDTRVIAGYLETISDADAFIREAESISHEKPILLIKAGVTWAGSRATSSHTGSLARSEAAYECIFERAGIVRCSSIKAQFDYARALATQPLPAGGNVAVITNGGGPSIMAADAIERQGLALAELDPAAVTAIAAAMPHGAAPGNPVDLLGDARASRYEAALRAALDSPAVDMVLVLLTPHAVTEIAETAEAVVRLAHGNHGKPILTSFLGGHRIDPAIDLLRRGRVPHHDTPESAVETMRVMLDYSRWRSRPRRVVKLFPVNRHKVERIAERNIRRGVFDLGGTDAMEVLDAYGFVAPKGAVATSAEQAAAVAAQIGFPVMLKIWSPDITNKSSVGGVRAGLNSAQEVTDAFDLMMYRVPKKAPGASIAGILVQETCARGREVMLGMTRDPHFGPLMMFGMGGLMVEVLKDVAFYLAPLTADEAREMLLRTRTYQMLRGAPGQEAIDIDAIAEGLQRLSQLAMEFQQIDEIEINPYIVGAQGITPVAVDARIVLAGKPKG